MKLNLDTDRMIAEVDSGIGWVTFNNPARLNALSMDMVQAIPAIFEAFTANEQVRVVVLRGAGGRAFVSGADISEFEEKRASDTARALYDERAQQAARAMYAWEKPMVAMIDGYCIGGGLMMALRADIRIAARGSQFAIPAARLGLGYGFAGVTALVNLVGPAAANDILFTARRLDSEEALRIGLVNRVVPAADLPAEVDSLAAHIAENAPLTIQAAKFAIREAMKDPSDRDMGAVAAWVERCFQSEDYVEGRRAFMEKRRPRFTGG